MPLPKALEFLNLIILRNTLLTWIIAISISVVVLSTMQFLKYRVGARYRSRMHGSKFLAARILEGILDSTRKLFMLLVSLYAGAQVLDVTPKTDSVLSKAIFIVFFVQIGLWGSSAVRTWLNDASDRRAQAGGQGSMFGVVGIICQLLLWALLLLITLDNLGVNITTLVAGLGVGGIAVALAVQNILGDLFSSLTIVLDKPFLIGDFIVVADFMGTIEHIGLKTTRVRSLNGEQIIFSNSDLLQSRIRNFKRMIERRVQFTFGLPLDAPTPKLQSIPNALQKIIEAEKEARFERAHFARITAAAFEFEIVYWVRKDDFKLYMDIQQRINFAIKALLEDDRILFAHATQGPRLRQESAPTAV
jgi:small-conductance mechanosensitive channel